MALRALVKQSRKAGRYIQPFAHGTAAHGNHCQPTTSCWPLGPLHDGFYNLPPGLTIQQTRSVHTAAERVEKARAPLPDPKPSVATFQVEVFTGDVRGAGCRAPALLQLIGEAGVSDELLIGHDGEEVGFERGSKHCYHFRLNKDLGDMRRLHVQQIEKGSSEASTSEPGTGWFLNQITVTTPEGTLWHFPCNSWIGETDADGLHCGMGRNLIPAEVPHLEEAHTDLPEPLKVSFGAIALPHPEKIADGGPKAVNKKWEGWGGEDAYFCTDERPGIFGLGVADGVYMWKAKGIDSGLFSRTLMSSARQNVKTGMNDVVKLFQSTDDQILKDDIQGSSTACLVLIDLLQGRLTSANLGDSGFLVLSEKQADEEHMHVKYHSPQQEHQFGFPYQLGHHENADSVESAMLMTLPVTSRDVVILGSDGLWDNIAVNEISALVREELEQGSRPSKIAQKLVSRAFEAAMDKNGVTPYSMGATEAFDMVYNGGKPDDITVVVTQLH